MSTHTSSPIARGQAETLKFLRAMKLLLTASVSEFFTMLDSRAIEPRLTHAQVTSVKIVLGQFARAILLKSQKSVDLLKIYPSIAKSLQKPQKESPSEKLRARVEAMRKQLAEKQQELQKLKQELETLTVESVHLDIQLAVAPDHITWTHSSGEPMAAQPSSFSSQSSNRQGPTPSKTTYQITPHRQKRDRRRGAPYRSAGVNAALQKALLHFLSQVVQKQLVIANKSSTLLVKVSQNEIALSNTIKSIDFIADSNPVKPNTVQSSASQRYFSGSY